MAAGDLALLAPPSHPDPRDAADSPLDLREVAFGQQDIRLVLAARTQGAWPVNGDSLCVLISRTSGFEGPRQLCVAGDDVLRYQGKRVAAVVSHAGATLRASVLPSALGLEPGPLWWVVQSAGDRVPDSGAFRTAISAFAAPRCFGAAARRSCQNPSLSKLAYPSSDDAAIWPSSPCTPLKRSGALHPCAFGVSAGRATFVLVGDSHAAHWRAALEVVAQAKRWRGLSITRAGCPFSTQIPASPALGPAECLAQHAATIAWLNAHPEVHTVFVSDWAEPPSGPQGGIGGYGGGAANYGAMIDRLPASVRHVYVLRDVPGTTLSSMLCVDSRLRHGRSIGTACASPRAAVLTPDPGAAAARGGRAKLLDLTRHFCDAARCFPVVGGVYVHKDDNHMNAFFAATLGPYVLRALSCVARQASRCA